jgi:hypothetical protein
MYVYFGTEGVCEWTQFDTLKLYNQIYLRDLSARKFLQLPAFSSCNHGEEKMNTKESSEFAFRIL